MARALIFPGQGAQYVGMGLDLAQNYPVARDLLDQADRVLGFSLSDFIANGPEEELKRTDISQPAILVVSMMALAVLRTVTKPLEFDAVAGLSLGEYSALVAADVIDFPTALALVRVRGQAMQAAADAVPSGMVALIGADEAQAAALCAAAAPGPLGLEVLQVANLNSPGQVVISGTARACARAMTMAKDQGIRKAMPLPVAGAFHSDVMAPAALRLRSALASTVFRPARVPVYANVDAKATRAASDFPAQLEAQLTKPVRWAESVVNMHAAGISEFWELGPGKSLCGMVTRTVKDVTVRNLDKAADVMGFASGASAGLA